MRIMGVDYGGAAVGVAISDELLLTAQPKEIIRRDRTNKLRRTFARLEELILENGVRLVVVGLPLHMNGAPGKSAEAARAFGDHLARRTGLPVVYEDERLTTVEAQEMMERMQIAPAKQKDYVDMLAANVILQEYLEHHRDELRERL